MRRAEPSRGGEGSIRFTFATTITHLIIYLKMAKLISGIHAFYYKKNKMKPTPCKSKKCTRKAVWSPAAPLPPAPHAELRASGHVGAGGAGPLPSLCRRPAGSLLAGAPLFIRAATWPALCHHSRIHSERSPSQVSQPRGVKANTNTPF